MYVRKGECKLDVHLSRKGESGEEEASVVAFCQHAAC